MKAFIGVLNLRALLNVEGSYCTKRVANPLLKAWTTSWFELLLSLWHLEATGCPPLLLATARIEQPNHE